MHIKPHRTATRLPLLSTLLAVCGATVTIAPGVFAQDPIRVESKQVLVPVYVMDKKRLRDLSVDRIVVPPQSELGKALLVGDMNRSNDILSKAVIEGLTALDFHVFDDGKEQSVQNVSYGWSLSWDLRDNLGYHTEYIGSGGGKWSFAEWPTGLAATLDFPHYLLAYALPESPEGSCHQIKVTVNRRNVVISARSAYCNTKHSVADPLNGTGLGEQLERAVMAPQSNNVKVTLLAIPLHLSSVNARVHIAVDWPPESLKGKSRAKGILGEVLKKDGSLVTRFSDLNTAGDLSSSDFPDLPFYKSDRAKFAGWVEDRYETQVDLPPGDYDLRVALGDGMRFGGAEVPLRVDSFNDSLLNIGPLSLCKQIVDLSDFLPQTKPKLRGNWAAKPASYLPLVSRDIEFTPTANTQFKKGEKLYTYFEVYEPLLAGETSATVQFQMRFVDAKTGKSVSALESIIATSYVKQGNPVIPIGRGIDISKLPQGSYHLDIRAGDSAGKMTDWRSVNFSVE